jgi:hypothetical protein
MNVIHRWKAAAAGAAVVVASGVVWAAIPHSATGDISGCVGKKGELRLIDAEAGDTCTVKEKPVQWPTRLTTVMRSTTFTSQMGYGNTATVNCAPGELALGGGYQLLDGIPSDRVQSVIGSYPQGTTAWQVQWYWNPNGEQWQVYVVCAKL